MIQNFKIIDDWFHEADKKDAFKRYDGRADAKEKLIRILEQVHREGVKEGITRFAWWKDGTQFVGTCGTTLKDALKEIEQEGN